MAKLTRWWPSASRRRANRPTPLPRSGRPAGSRRPGWPPATRSTAAPARRSAVDLGRVLHRPERAEHGLGGVGTRCSGNRAWRSSEEPGPGAVADGRDPLADPATPATISTGSSVSLHGRRREHVGPLDHPGRLQPGHHQRGLALAGQDQHGQPLERHGLVAGQPGQVGPDREQHGVDPVAAHGRPHPLHPLHEPTHSLTLEAELTVLVAALCSPRHVSATGTRGSAGVDEGGVAGLGGLAGVVARAGERAGLDVADAEGLARHLAGGRTRRASTSGATGRWCGGRAQVLADGDDVDADARAGRPGRPRPRRRSRPGRR